MLELRSCCEMCHRDLPPGSTDARICSFECTFCASCADAVLHGSCPNCGGELLPRPRRPAAKLARNPPATTPASRPQARDAAAFPREGGCDCRGVRYRMNSAPLIVHCCHCRWCQRESGASFAVNAMIESERVELLAGQPEFVHTPSESGKGQEIVRCPRCRVAVWSHYAGAGPLLSFVRVGTLDEADGLPPDIHIFTASKQPWVVIPPGVPAVPEYYEREQYWPPGSLARREALLPAIAAYQAARGDGKP